MMFEAKFNQSSTFRKIIDSMKDLVKNVNIDITQKGISIQSIDSCHIALVFLQLKEKAFVSFNCQKPFSLGITIQNVSKILKIAGSDDSLTLSCDDEPTQLKFRFQSKKGDKISEFNLGLINIDTQSLGLPQSQFTSICTMPSNQFGRICRQFLGLAESIRIQASKENIKFSISGQLGTGSTIFSQQDTGSESDSIILQVEEPVAQNYASRYLHLFSKAGALANQVTLSMATETPIVVTYHIMNSCGEIKYYLAPKITEEE